MLLTSPRIAASHASAAQLYDLPYVLDEDLRATGVWLNEAPTRSSREARIRRWRDPVEAPVVVGSWQCVPPAMACVQVAMDRGCRSGVFAMDAALHRGLVQRCDLQAAVRATVGMHSHAAAEVAARRSDGRAESPAESLGRLVIEDLGYDLEPQFEVRGALGQLIGRVDWRIRDTKVLIEVDGLQKYEGESGRDALAREKARENELRALGWVIVRLTWADLHRPAVVDARIRAALAAAR